MQSGIGAGNRNTVGTTVVLAAGGRLLAVEVRDFLVFSTARHAHGLRDFATTPLDVSDSFQQAALVLLRILGK